MLCRSWNGVLKEGKVKARSCRVRRILSLLDAVFGDVSIVCP